MADRPYIDLDPWVNVEPWEEQQSPKTYWDSLYDDEKRSVERFVDLMRRYENAPDNFGFMHLQLDDNNYHVPIDLTKKWNMEQLEEVFPTKPGQTIEHFMARVEMFIAWNAMEERQRALTVALVDGYTLEEIEKAYNSDGEK